MKQQSKSFYGIVLSVMGLNTWNTGDVCANKSSSTLSDVGRGTIQRNDFLPTDSVSKEESSLTRNARTSSSFKSDAKDPTDVARGTIQRNDFNPSQDVSKVQSQSLDEKIESAKGRLHAAQALFKSEGISGAIHILNNKTADTTERGRINESNMANLTEPMDGISGVNCIVNGRWKADGTGKKEGQSAASWVDAEGNSVLDKIISALRASKNDVVEISYTSSGSHESRTIVAGDSKFFMNDNSGEKFLCFVEIS